MKRGFSRDCEALEARKLLATAHVATAPPAVPVAIDGTLAVNVNDTSQSQNLDSTWTTTVPVTGVLGELGKVKGYWSTTVDQNGNYLGPDKLTLTTRSSKGSVVIGFNNLNKGKPTKVSPGLGFYQHGEHLLSGSGAYAHATEDGSIELMDNLKKGDVTSLVLITVPPATPATS